MRNWEDEEDDYNYSPNELANLSRSNPAKYQQIVNSNLDEDDTIDKWETRNREFVQNLKIAK